ncbi:hypothetical protein [Terrabacter sp. NPDC080008]|uniref:hypothetical protein n=1 Tax=Terrabacter sp. NPDC080008 TaxID=3155176 RepID=UPI00344B9CBA
MSADAELGGDGVTRAPEDRLDPHRAAAIVDVFVYVVVLNLFVEYLPAVISETFTLSLLTAVLLKVILEVVVAVKNRVRARYRRASGPAGKLVAASLLWVVLFGSKFVVLEAVALVFGDRVTLGGFASVTLLAIALLLSRAFVRRLLRTPHRTPLGADAPRRRGGTHTQA